MRFLFGKFKHAIDAKGRVSVPQRFRMVLAELGEKSLVILEGFEGCLFCYPPSVFAKILTQLSSGEQDFQSEDVRELLRYLAANGSEVDMDGQGRVPLTEAQRSAASLNREAYMVGVGNRIEIWSPKEFDNRPKKATGSSLAEGLLRKLDLALDKGRDS